MHDNASEALHAAIAALETQRTALGDALVDAALGPLLERRALLNAEPASKQPVRHLRQVSVLFLDLVGSTQLIQHLDPEEVQAVVDGALATLAGVVRAHGGEVLRYAGDSLKAAFGARRTHEDDAERAVLCGLELLQATAGLRHGLAGQDQAPLSARVGIHTGPVVRGGGVENDNSLSGLAVIIAARMEQTAPANALRISQDTWALVRGAFDGERQAPITVKGLDEPMATWLVKAAKPRALRLPARGIAGQETPLVGRDDELARFDAAVQALLADRQPRSLTLLAEAGLGKSPLLREFQHRLSALGSRWWLLPARAQPSGSLQPYGRCATCCCAGWRLPTATAPRWPAPSSCRAWRPGWRSPTTRRPNCWGS
jgi:class 3 adenylate cyclase